MRMNSGIILSGNQPDILGRMQQGMQMGQFQQDANHQNALRAMLQEQGPGIMQGEQNALSEMARFDPGAALGVQQTRQGMDHAEQRLQLAYQQANREAQRLAHTMSEADRARESETIQRALAMGTQAQTPEQWDQVMQSLGATDYVGQFGQRDMLIAGALGVRDALGMNAQPEAPTSVREFEYGQQNPAFLDYQTDRARAGGTNINIGAEGQRMGTVPPGFAAVQDPSNPSGYRLEPIPGGPAEREAQQAETQAEQRQTNRARAGSTVVQDLQRALDLMPELGALSGSGGVVGGLARTGQARIPGSVVNRITQFTESALSNVGLDTLQAMREASPTGGALGQVPIQQQRRLEQVLGSLDITQPPEVLEANIQRVINIYNDIIYGDQRERQRAVEQGRMTPEQSQEIEGYYYSLPFDAQGRPVGGQPQGQQQPGQGGTVTPEQIRTMPRSEVLNIDVMSLDAEGLRELERRLQEPAQ